MRIKKQKTQKRCVIKRNKLISKNLKTERHNVFTEKNNKIALSSKNYVKKCNELFQSNICIWNDQTSIM